MGEVVSVITVLYNGSLTHRGGYCTFFVGFNYISNLIIFVVIVEEEDDDVKNVPSLLLLLVLQYMIITIKIVIIVLYIYIKQGEDQGEEVPKFFIIGYWFVMDIYIYIFVIIVIAMSDERSKP